MIVPAIILVILASIIGIISVIYSVFLIRIRIRNNTRVNALINAHVLLFVITIVIDCVRVIIVLGFNEHFPDLDIFGYYGKVIAIFISFALISQIHLVLSEYVGYQQKYHKLIRTYLVVVAITLSILSGYYSFQTIPVETGFYVYQFNLILYFGTFLAYLPVAAIIFLRNISILRAVKNKEIYKKLVLFTIVSIFLVGERGFNLGGYNLAFFVFNASVESSLIADLLSLTIIAAMFLFIMIKHPDLMESIGAYFSIKKLYLLKDNGLLIFEYDFDRKELRDGFTSEDTLIGGFIFATTEGFSEILQSNEKLNSFTSGDRSVLIHHGGFIFGVLLVTEDCPLMHQKLMAFIQRFETHYEQELKSWTGEYSVFDKALIQKWIFELLREI